MADWRSLLEIALPALDEVFGSGADPSSPDWTVGGGAAIGVELDHRGTEDVDIFLQRGRLKQFLPRSNAASKAISETPQWPGHHLKFELQSGEIDFLTAPLLTEPGFANRLMLGRSIAFETPEEVLVKKMRYRAATFTARDVFDLAVVLHCQPGLPDVLAAEVSDKLAVVQERIRLHASRGIAAIEQQISPTRFGRGILPHVFELAERAVSEARSAARAASPTPRSIAKGPDDVRDPGIGPRPVHKGRDR